MRLIDITGLNITHWKAECDGRTKYYPKGKCKQPETALNRTKKVFVGKITITGLLMHAETKPIIIE